MSTNIKVVDNITKEITREATEREWDSNDICWHHNIEGYSIVGKDEYSDITVPFKVNKSIGYFLVYVLYNTGDSFHREENCIDFIDMFENKESAELIVKVINNDYRKYKKDEDNDNFSITLPGLNGEDYSIHCSWKGYFERLTDVCIEQVYYR